MKNIYLIYPHAWSLTVLLTVITVFPCLAQKTILVLNDGSKLEGYISMQQPGSDMQFYASKMLGVVSTSSLLQSPEDVLLRYDKLSDDWAWWAEQNYAFTVREGIKYLKLSCLHRCGQEVPDTVRVTNQTADCITFLDFPNRNYDFDWSEIARVEKTLRSARSNEGLDDEVELRDGTKLQGQIIEQIPGISVTLHIHSSRNVEIDLSNIVVSRKIAVNPQKTLWEQRTYKNIVHLKNGAKKSGLIVEQHMGATDESNYLLLLTSGGYTEKILFSQVERYLSLPL